MPWRTYDRLLRKCEEAKRQLTVAPSADIDLEFPSSVCKAKNLEDPNFSLTLMQSRVRELIQKDIDSCVAMTEKAILECGLTKDDITAVVLIGGNLPPALREDDAGGVLPAQHRDGEHQPRYGRVHRRLPLR